MATPDGLTDGPRNVMECSLTFAMQLGQAISTVQPNRLVYVDFDVAEPADMLLLHAAFQLARQSLGNVEQSITTQALLTPNWTCRPGSKTLVVHRFGTIASVVRGTYCEYSFSNGVGGQQFTPVSPSESPGLYSDVTEVQQLTLTPDSLTESQSPPVFQQTDEPVLETAESFAGDLDSLIFGFELSSPQKRVWILDCMEGRSWLRCNVLMHYDGILTEMAVRHSAQVCIQSNECLRTAIHKSADTNVFQSVLSGTKAHLLLQKAVLPVEVDSAPSSMQHPILVQLYSINHTVVLHSSLHPIIADTVSLSELCHQLADFYDAYLHNEASFRQPSTKYWHFVEYEKQIEHTEAYAASRTFWDGYFESYEITKLPVDEFKGSQAVLSVTGVHFSCLIDKTDLLPRLMGVWFCMLSNMSACSELLLGLVVHGRPPWELASVRRVIGCFANALAVRLHRDGEFLSERKFIQFIAAEIELCLEHSRIPFDYLVQCISTSAEEQICPFFLAYHSTDNNSSYAEFSGNTGGTTVIPSGSISTDIVLNVGLSEASHTFSGVLLHSMSFYTDTVKNLLLTQCQMLKKPVSSTLKFSSYFQQNVAKFSPRVALQNWEGCAMQSNDICNTCQIYTGPNQFRFIRSAISITSMARSAVISGCKVSSDYQKYVGHNPGQESSFCCLLKRSLFQFLGCISALLTSMVYVPLDSNYPKWRTSYILGQCSATEAVFHSGDKFSSPKYAPAIRATPSDIVYVIFTSGSTGLPKGVCIIRSAYSQTSLNVIHYTKAEPSSLMIQHCSYIFDSSMFDFCFLLANRSSLIILQDSHQLVGATKSQHVQLYYVVTNVLNRMTKSEVKLLGENLSKILVGGEALLNPAIKMACNYEMHLTSFYGPTEMTICSAVRCMSKYEIGNNIGKAFVGEIAAIFDSNERLSNVGILTISGSAVSRGYISKPNLTSEVFKANSLCSVEQRQKSMHQTSYVTGDAAKFWPNGDIHYVGRFDSQIKLYGYRIEVSEIEQQLMNLGCIESCCVVVHKLNENHFILVAFYVANGAGNESSIKKSLSAVLPAFMIPQTCKQLSYMPVTLSGKLDRNQLEILCKSALNSTQFDTADKVSKSHVQSLEEKVCAIWSELLNIDQVTRQDDFFMIGGTSLDIIRLWTLYQAAGLNISWSKAHQLSNMEQLLDYFSRQSDCDNLAKTTPVITVNTSLLAPPIWGFELTTPQKRIWLFEQMRQEIFWRAEVLMHYVGILNDKAGRISAHHCIQCNDCLRYLLPCSSSGSGLQYTLSGTEAHVEINLERVAAIADSETSSLLQKPVLINLMSVNGCTVLFNSLHHMIMDAVSASEFHHQLADFYQMYLRSAMSYDWSLSAKYWHFMEHERALSQTDLYSDSLAFWNDYLADYEVVKLPSDTSGNTLLQSNKAIHFSCLIFANFSKLLPKLVGAWFCILSSMCASSEILLGLPVYGRPAELLHIDKVIGCFINIVLVRLKRSTSYFAEGMHLQSIVDEITMCLDNSRIPYELMVQCIANTAEQTCPMLLNYIAGMKSGHCLFRGNSGRDKVNTIGSGISRLHDIVLNANKDCERNRLHGNLIHNSRFYSDNIKYLLFKQCHLLFALFGSVNTNNVGLRRYNVSSRLQNQMKDSCVVQSETICSNPQLYSGNQQFRVGQSAIMLNSLASVATYTGCRVSSEYQTHIGQSVGQEAAFCCQLKRNILLFLGCVASLLTCMVYVPLDYNYPISRKCYILQQCGAIEAVCHAGSALFPGASAPLIKSTPCDLAYIIFTSGSTGLPKGVCITRSAYSQTVANMIEICKARPFSVMLQHSSYIFDSSMFDFCFFLANRCSLIVLENSHNLSEISRQANIEYSFLVTNVLNRMTKEDVRLLGDKLSKLIVGGESLHNQAIQLANAQEMQLISIYGPTETTICSTTKQFRHSDIGSDIGRANLGELPIMLDYTEQPACTGMLVISGSSVARGYISKPSLTKDVFKANSVCSIEQRHKTIHHTAYSTGDAAKFTASGNVYYLGRRDSQIKLYGYRIEMSEIEQQLMKLSCIANCCIVHTVVNEHATLVAFYVPINGRESDETEIKKDLSAVLPAYMIPRKFIQLQEMPSTPSGKLDRKELEAIGKEEIDRSQEVNDVAGVCFTKSERQIGGTQFEEKILAIWCSLLNTEKISRDDDFFLMGGTSLDVIRLWSLYRSAGIDISLAKAHQCSTMQKLLDHLCTASPSDHPVLIYKPPPMLQDSVQTQDIQIDGIAGMFSNSRSIQELWQGILQGHTDCITRSPLLNSSSFIAAVGHMPDAKLFDPQFWDMPKTDADIVDPQIRKLLVCGWNAIENSGLCQCLRDYRIAAFLGCGHNSYYDELMEQDHDSLASWKLMHLNEFFTPATMFSYKLGLTGASVGLNTACSTALVALYAACQALLNGQCEVAIAGSSAFPLPSKTGYAYVPDSISSNDGYCRPFDARATGTLPGAGAVCTVVRKRCSTSSNDNPLAIIKGLAVNNDGFRTGYTKPKVEGQQECIERAITDAGIHPSQISFVECHGTGTFIGDPIEIQALHAAHSAFGPPERSCILGSVKANIGHADCASGLVGVAKICKMFQEGLMPPQLHFQSLNPHLSEYMQGYSIAKCLSRWVTYGEHRYAGISSFGIGGTNAHAILADFSQGLDKIAQTPGLSAVFPLSAKTQSSLEKLKEKFAEFLQGNLCQSAIGMMTHLARGRKRFAHRTACFTHTNGYSPFLNGETMAIDQPAVVPLAFIYPGQGLHLKDLLAATKPYDDNLLPEHNRVLTKCMTQLTAITGIHVEKLSSAMHEESKHRALLSRTEWLQPLVAAVELAQTIQLKKWSFQVDLAVGHSLGEYAALFVAGVFPNIDELLHFLYTRAWLMQQTANGRMLSVSQNALSNLNCLTITEKLTAAVNPSGFVTLSGTTANIEYMESKLIKFRLSYTNLPVRKAFHSHLMEPILSALGEAAFFQELHKPNCEVLSNVSGRCFSSNEAVNSNYFPSHVRHTVQFRKCVEYIQSHDSGKLIVEAGPGKICTKMLKSSSLVVLPTLSMNSQSSSWEAQNSHADCAPLSFLCHLWLRGVELPWEQIFPEMIYSHRSNTQSIPNYQFDDIECWMPKAESRKRKRSQLEENHAVSVYTDYYGTIWTSNVIHRVEKLEQTIKPKFMVISGCNEAERIIKYIHHCGNAVKRAEFCKNRQGGKRSKGQASGCIDLTKNNPMMRSCESHPDIILLLTETSMKKHKPYRMSKLLKALSLVHHNILAYCKKKTAFYALCYHAGIEDRPLNIGALAEMESIRCYNHHVNTAIIDIEVHDLPQLAQVIVAETIFSYWNQDEPTYISIDDGYLSRQQLKTLLNQAVAELERENEISDIEVATNDDLMDTHIIYLNTVATISIAFSEVLGTSAKAVNADSSFFDLGGTSLSGIQLVETLKDKLHCQLNLNDLLSSGSPASLAHIVLSTDKQSSNEILIPLKSSTTADIKLTVVIIHAAGGCLFQARVFCDIMPDNCAFYGIQYPYTLKEADEEVVENDLCSLAALYVSKLLEVTTADTPLILMGASLGGTVAYEMQMQLVKQKFATPVVVGFDSWAKFPASLTDEIDREIHDNHTCRIAGQLEGQTHSQSQAPDTLVSAIVATTVRLMKMLLKYEVKPAPIGNCVYLFKSAILDELHRSIDALEGFSGDNYWAELANCAVSTAEIDCDHYSILGEANVEPIKVMLSNVISELC